MIFLIERQHVLPSNNLPLKLYIFICFSLLFKVVYIYIYICLFSLYLFNIFWSFLHRSFFSCFLFLNCVYVFLRLFYRRAFAFVFLMHFWFVLRVLKVFLRFLKMFRFFKYILCFLRCFFTCLMCFEVVCRFFTFFNVFLCLRGGFCGVVSAGADLSNPRTVNRFVKDPRVKHGSKSKHSIDYVQGSWKLVNLPNAGNSWICKMLETHEFAKCWTHTSWPNAGNMGWPRNIYIYIY